MANVYDCVASYRRLLGIEYKFILGRKGQKVAFSLRFEKSECHHLMGLQYLKDIPKLRGSSSRIFDKLEAEEIPLSLIEGSKYYCQIEDRVHFMTLLEEMIDDNDTVFKYNSKKQPNSKIKAEFLLENIMDKRKVFLFIDKREDEGYFCRSFFPENTRDFSKGQPRYTLLYKEKINLTTGERIVLYDKLTPKS